MLSKLQYRLYEGRAKGLKALEKLGSLGNSDLEVNSSIRIAFDFKV